MGRSSRAYGSDGFWRLRQNLQYLEHVRLAAEHFGIIDDELWFKAAEKLKQLEDKEARRFLGG
jgi:hypothetical protein